MRADVYATLSRMTHIVLALGHPHGPASTPGTPTYWFAIGLLVGIASAFFAPGWLTALVITFDLVALGWSSVILHYTDTGTGRWVLVAALFLAIGLYLGVMRGLKYLGEAEYGTRLGNIRKNGRWF
jgi:hypothetical protein